MAQTSTPRNSRVEPEADVRRADIEAEAERPLSELLTEMTRDLSALLRKEVELAKVETKEEMSRISKAGAMLGAGGYAAAVAVLLLSFAAAWGLAAVIPSGWAFLIVGAVWAIAATILILIGRNRMKEVDVVPEQTVETLKEDAQWAKEQMS